MIGFERLIRPLLGGTADEARVAEAMPRAQVVFQALSGLLGDQAYFGGDSLSLADLMVGPQLVGLTRVPEWPALIAGRDNLESWTGRMRARESFRETTPEKVAALGARVVAA